MRRTTVLLTALLMAAVVYVTFSVGSARDVEDSIERATTRADNAWRDQLKRQLNLFPKDRTVPINWATEGEDDLLSENGKEERSKEEAKKKRPGLTLPLDIDN